MSTETRPTFLNPAYEEAEAAKTYRTIRSKKALLKAVDTALPPIAAPGKRREKTLLHTFMGEVVSVLAKGGRMSVDIRGQDGVHYRWITHKGKIPPYMFYPQKKVLDRRYTGIARPDMPLGAEAPVLYIEKPELFQQKLEQLLAAMKSHSDTMRWLQTEHRYYDREIALELIWNNATPYDFQHPLQYLDRVRRTLEDTSFKEYHLNPTDKGEIPALGGHLFVKRTSEPGSYETAHALYMELRPDSALDVTTFTGHLPTVRYTVDGQTAYIYAVQNPPVDTEKTERETSDTCTRLTRAFKTRYAKFAADYKKMLGEIPAHILKMEEPRKFIAAYAAFLQQTRPELFEQGYVYEWVNGFMPVMEPDEADNSIYHNFASDIARLPGVLKDIKRVEGNRKKLLRRLYELDSGLPEEPEYAAYKKEHEAYTPLARLVHEREEHEILSKTAYDKEGEIDEVKRLRTLLREKRRELKQKGMDPYKRPDSYYPENLLDVFRPSLVSAATALCMLQQEGVVEVKIPTLLPIRWLAHVDSKGMEESERIQKATTDDLIRLFRRLSEQIKGVELTSLGEEDNYLRIKLSHEPMHSDNKLLDTIIKTVSKKQ